jgi:spermidine synthase
MRQRTYLRFPTKFGQARIYQVEDDDGAPVRLLEVGGIVQSGTYVDERYTELVFEYLKRYDLMFEGDRPIRRVAVLGCGGYDYPEHLVAHHPDVQVDAVEVDPAITAIARRYFFLDRVIEEFCEGSEPAGSGSASGNTDAFSCEQHGRLHLICADALAFLQATDACYDAIVNDCFDAGTPPAHLTDRTFAEAVHARLTPGGLYLTNIVSPLEGPRASFLREQVALLESVFAQVPVHPCDPDNLTEPDNVIVIAPKSE